MLIAYLLIVLCFQSVIAQQQQNTELSARELDSLLQDYAFRAFVRPRTGIVFDGQVPSNLTGIGVVALRLRSGSLRRRGFVGYKEFHIPVGVVEQPYVERLVLVYHNLGNWSSLYYPLPGYMFITPILGLLAYDATDLSATNLSELDIRASGDPISVMFPGMKLRPKGQAPPPMCVYFGVDGSVEFNNVVNGDTCLTTNQGHFAIAVESPVAPAPAPSGGGGGGGGATGVGGGGEGRSKRVWIIGGSVVGGVALLVLVVILFGCLQKCRRRKKIQRMEEASEFGVALPMTRIGNTKAPVALQTRTRPLLENEFVP